MLRARLGRAFLNQEEAVPGDMEDRKLCACWDAEGGASSSPSERVKSDSSEEYRLPSISSPGFWFLYAREIARCSLRVLISRFLSSLLALGRSRRSAAYSASLWVFLLREGGAGGGAGWV